MIAKERITKIAKISIKFERSGNIEQLYTYYYFTIYLVATMFMATGLLQEKSSRDKWRPAYFAGKFTLIASALKHGNCWSTISWWVCIAQFAPKTEELELVRFPNEFSIFRNSSSCKT